MTERPRLNPTDLCMSDASPFQQHYEARTTWPLTEALTDQYLVNIRGQLRAGDSITVCRYDGRDNNHRSIKLLEVATVRVLSVEADCVPLAFVGEIYCLPGSENVPTASSLSIAPGKHGKHKLMAGDKLVQEFGSRPEAEAALDKAVAA